ncbi:MAG: alpha-xylosidase, partial [Coprococcus sp.]
PLKVFHFDCFWMKGFQWTDFTWDSDVFPDPKGMLERIKAKGLKVCVWINPYIAQESCLFDEGMAKGYFLRRPDGSVWQWDMWQPGMAIVDFTNPDACAWYKGKLAELVDMGVDCFKTDFGERIPVDCVYASGMAPEKMHNYYTYLYNKVVFDVLKEKKGENEACLFARSTTVGGQKFPVHWGGDCWSDYESMEESIRGGLSLQMSGFGFWSHDIGGFEHTSTADVYKRWCAFGLLSSHSRLHGSTSYRVPWAYDDEAVDVVRHFTRLKARIMPYLWKTAVNAHETGIPCMRAMVLEYPNDKMCCYLDKQYMLGDSLLVAPVFNADSVAEYYLPEAGGNWTDFETGEQKKGGSWYKEKIGYTSIPLYVKPNSIIAVGAVDDDPVYDYAENVTYRIYEPNGRAETVIYDANTDKTAEIVTDCVDGILDICVCSDKAYTIELVNIVVNMVKGAEYRIEKGSTILYNCSKQINCILK